MICNYLRFKAQECLLFVLFVNKITASRISPTGGVWIILYLIAN